MRKHSPFPRRPASARPRKPDPGARSPGPSYPALEFAKKFEMLTDEEIEACENGRAEVQSSWLIYRFGSDGLPAHLLPAHLYEGRRLDLLADRLLGLDQQDED